MAKQQFVMVNGKTIYVARRSSDLNNLIPLNTDYVLCLFKVKENILKDYGSKGKKPKLIVKTVDKSDLMYDFQHKETKKGCVVKVENQSIMNL